MAAGYVVAVVGATGAAGSTTLKILAERKFPVRELRCYASERSAGKTVSFMGDELRVEKVGPEAFKGVEIAFFSAGSAQSKEYAPLAVRAGGVVVDKSSAFRMDPTVPLVVPEINPHAAEGHSGIVASPNCTTVVTVMPLKPLHDAARLRRVIATSYQAVSGAGVKGVEELRRQALAWARGEALKVEYFPHQIAFNLIPHIDRFADNGYTEEELKLIHEIRKILELPDLKISPTTVRVPVFTAHSIAVNVETDEPLTPARARDLFADFPGLRVWDDPGQNRYPMPVGVEGQDDCFVGRIRADLSLANGLNFWVVGDQLRKGAATNAVQIAELLIREGGVPNG
ncbi:MAG: aspartate-semialdehyde dehydrogenase [Candidatus Rokubacteria bacterium]|nr:aspartate-semialdehyde dehydrogenase [Candidatus Rokubacteria bacterium]